MPEERVDREILTADNHLSLGWRWNDCLNELEMLGGGERDGPGD
jgi:hypothetical protein